MDKQNGMSQFYQQLSASGRVAHDISEHASALLNLILCDDEDGVIEGNIELQHFSSPQFDEDGRLLCKMDVAYAENEAEEDEGTQRTDYCVIPIRLWMEQDNRIGWELRLKDGSALAGPQIGYLPDLPQLARFPISAKKQTKRKLYKFADYDLNLLRMHPAGKRERVRRMSPSARQAALQHIYWLDDDLMIELGRTPQQPLTAQDIQPGMIVRRGAEGFRLVCEVGEKSNHGPSCLYVPYRPACAWLAINPPRGKAEVCTTSEFAAWAERVIAYNGDDQVLYEDWNALKAQQEEGGEGKPV